MTADQILTVIFCYEVIGVIAAIISGIAIVFYRRRREIEENRNRPVDIHILRISIPYKGDYENYVRVDYTGRGCDHVITFEEFYNKWLKHYLGSCHDFTPEGFLYDEGGSMGFDNTEVGFATKRDIICYRRWLHEQATFIASGIQIVQI